MLVSKLYLSEAARRYVEGRVFFFEDSWALQDAVEKGCAINRNVIRLIRSVRVSVLYGDDGLDRLALLPNLSKLEICIARWTLTKPGELSEDDQLSDFDLLKRLMVAGLRKVRGLNQVRVTEVDPSSNQPREGSQKVQSLLSRIERELTRIIT